MITIAEGTGRIPRGTHDWNKFLTPEELTALLRDAGLHVVHTQGLGFSPATGFTLSDSTSLDYFLTAVKACLDPMLLRGIDPKVTISFGEVLSITPKRYWEHFSTISTEGLNFTLSGQHFIP
jgi:hypothetical protein